MKNEELTLRVTEICREPQRFGSQMFAPQPPLLNEQAGFAELAVVADRDLGIKGTDYNRAEIEARITNPRQPGGTDYKSAPAWLQIRASLV